MTEPTFHTIVAEYRNGVRKTIDTIEDLDQILDRWDTEAREAGPTLVFLDVGDVDNHLYIGVGQDNVPVSCGYRHAVALHPSSTEEQEWAFANTWQKVGPDELVPSTDARESARRWARTGTCPTNLEWEP